MEWIVVILWLMLKLGTGLGFLVIGLGMFSVGQKINRRR